MLVGFYKNIDKRKGRRDLGVKNENMNRKTSERSGAAFLNRGDKEHVQPWNGGREFGKAWRSVGMQPKIRKGDPQGRPTVQSAPWVFLSFVLTKRSGWEGGDEGSAAF